MKQLSSSELNSMSKEDLAAMVLQMQQQINTLNEKVAVLNARHFGRSTEKLETLPGQMNIFNETEVAAAEAIAEPAIEQVVVRRKKNGQRKEDLSRLPKRIENHELTKEQLKAIFGEKAADYIPTKPGFGVRYVLPQRFNKNADADVSLFLRVTQPFDKVKFTVKSGDTVLTTAKRMKAAPGEMEKLTIKKELLETITGAITVSLEEV